MYSAELGRFLQMDPIKFDAGDPNIFRYVGNDPVNLTDPEGLLPWAPIMRGAVTAYMGYKALNALKNLIDAAKKAIDEGNRKRDCQNNFDGNSDDPSVNNPDKVSNDPDKVKDVVNNLKNVIKDAPSTSFTGVPGGSRTVSPSH
jgi:uncharacterized protein RhaS with RHS repeats